MSSDTLNDDFSINLRASIAQGEAREHSRASSLRNALLCTIHYGHGSIITHSAIETIEVESYREEVQKALHAKIPLPQFAPGIIEVRGAAWNAERIIDFISEPFNPFTALIDLLSRFSLFAAVTQALKTIENPDPATKALLTTALNRRAILAQHILIHDDYARFSPRLSQHIKDILAADKAIDLGASGPQKIAGLDEILPDPVSISSESSFRAAQIEKSKKFSTDWSASEKPDEISDIFLDSLTSADRAIWERKKIRRQNSSAIHKILASLPEQLREDSIPHARDLLLPHHLAALTADPDEHTAPLSAAKNKARIIKEIGKARENLKGLKNYRDTYYPSTLTKIKKNLTKSKTFNKASEFLFGATVFFVVIYIFIQVYLRYHA